MTKGNYYVYILTNPRKTVLYVGVTDDLRRRVIQHRQERGNPKTFTGRYFCHKLIYYEYFHDIFQAIYREKEIKNMTRQMKEQLIATMNPKWHTLIV